MLFDLLEFRKRLPNNVLVFASGANREPEIRGFAGLGIPVGVSVNHLNEAAITALIESRIPAMIDSGAFSEIAFTADGPVTVSPIDEQDWRRRLGVYLRLASVLGENQRNFLSEARAPLSRAAGNPSIRRAPYPR